MFKMTCSAAAVMVSLMTVPASARSHHHRHHSSHNVKDIATRIAREEGVNPSLIHAIMRVESNGNCHARSSAGAIGVMQVKPATARSMGVYGNLTVCENSLRAGIRYFRAALAMNRGNVCAAASGYNMGIGIRGRCTGYGRKVMAHVGRPHYASLR